jgi:predicted branched-subunit amino acid permease
MLIALLTGTSTHAPLDRSLTGGHARPGLMAAVLPDSWAMGETKSTGEQLATGPGRSDLAALCLTFFALGVTVNVLVLERVGSESLTIVAAVAINSATTELAYLAVRDAGGTQLAAVIAGWVVASRFGLLAVSLGARLRVGRWHRAAAGLQSFDPNVTWAIQQRRARDVVRVFWRTTLAMHVGWLSGIAVGVFLGNVIGDTQRLGLDAVFPAALLAIIGNLLRRGDGALAAVVGGGVCLLLIPIAPAGVPIIASLAGAFVALAMKPEAAS